MIEQVKALALFAVAFTAFASEWTAVAALEPGSGVKVKALRSGQLSGRLSRATSQAICVVRNNVETCIDKADVLWVRIKAGKARARNAAIAGGVTAAIWTTFVVLAWRGTSDSDAIPGLLGYGIPFWGGAAAGIAALFPGYTTVYKLQ